MSIFPAQVRDVENLILSQMDAPSLLHLSRTHHAAHDIITDAMFKRTFMSVQPEALFPHVQKHFPHCCWKMTSYLTEKPVVVFSEDFLRSSVVYQAEKEAIEQQTCVLREKYQAICGVGYQDPNSPIHKAWAAYETARNVAQQYMEKDHHDEPIPEIVNQRGEYYHALDRDRARIECQLGALSTQLERSEKNVLAALLVDQYFIRSVFWIAQELYPLKSIDIANAAFAAEVMRNSFDVKVRDIIYEILYHQCAKGVTEDCWAERHCQLFSHEIQNICHLLVENLNDLETAYNIDLESTVGHYVSQNKEIFCEALSTFTEILHKLEDTLEEFRKNSEKSSINFKQILDGVFEMMWDQIVDLPPAVFAYLDFLNKFWQPSSSEQITKECVEEVLDKNIKLLYLLIASINESST